MLNRTSRLSLFDISGSQNRSNKASNIISIMRTDNLSKEDYETIKIELAKNYYDIENCKLLFEELNFEELIRINDHMLIYATDNDEFAVQNVNNKHIYIEIEDKCNYANRFYNSIEEMKKVIIDNSIPIKNNNYFIKKAEIELQESFDK